MAKTVRRDEPRLFMRMERNHFQSSQNGLSGVTEDLITNRGGYILSSSEPLQTTLMASEMTRTYRFAIVNAVHNPKTLLGDDPERCPLILQE